MESLMERTPTKLNKQQLEMLRLLDKPLPESDYLELKKRIVQILTKQLDEEMEKLENKNGWTAETYEQWGNEHNRIASK
ncbi:MAG: hypothetical protein ABIX01_02455 [Chitinophagaceae bacterium]